MAIDTKVKMLSILKKMEKAGYRAYATGSCLSRVLTGEAIEECNIVTTTPLEELTSLFPKLEVQGETASFVFSEGKMSMAVRFEQADSIQSYFSRQICTIDRVALTADDAWVDPDDHMNDCLYKCLNTAEDPKALFRREPTAMLKVIERAADTGFRVTDPVLKAARKYAKHLRKADPAVIRASFEHILTGAHAGYGLEMVGMMDCLQAIIGLRRARIMKTRELRTFKDLWEEMDKVPNDRIERLSIFYLCFEGHRMVELTDLLPYDEAFRTRIREVEKLLPKISMVRKKEGLKELIDEIGLETYQFLDQLTVDQAKISGLSEKKIDARRKMFEEIEGEL